MKTVESAILSTDLAMYFKKRNAFLELVENGEFDWQGEEKKDCKYLWHMSRILNIFESAFSAVWHDDDGLRCKCHSQALGGAASRGQAGGRWVLRPGRSGEAAAEHATGGHDGQVNKSINYNIIG